MFHLAEQVRAKKRFPDEHKSIVSTAVGGRYCGLYAGDGTALNWPWVNINFMANLLLGVIFIVIGNYLPKCRQNYTIGIKLPWTLSDTENWDRTHRFAGKIWMLCGVLEIIVGFLPIAQFEIVTIALILLATIPVAVYSYLLYRKKMG